MRKEIWYGLFYIPKDKMVGFETTGSDGEDCVSVEFNLSVWSENLWLVREKEQAEKARTTNTSWYNAGYQIPGNPFKPEDLRVVELVIEVEEVK
jgi:hypothetical protein